MNKKSLKVTIAIVLVLTLFTVPVLASDTGTDLAAKLNGLINIIQAYYYRDVTTDELVDGAIKGMFQTLDTHSSYYNDQEFKDLMDDLSGEFGGIGIVVEKKDYITVVSPIEGTPGWRAGLKSGDQIVEVDGTDISDYALDQAVDLMRGDPGTKVRIGIRRVGEADIIYFDIIREIIKVNPVSYEIKDNNIGYIKITQFTADVYSKTKAALEEMKKNNVKGIIFDLRANPGGYLDQVVAICKELIPAGPIVKIEYKNDEEIYSSTLKEAPYKLVVLVNGGSASASEIMSGAIKDSGAGILVGEKTYGKGSVQSVLTLIGGGGIKITTAHYLTPSGFALDGVGLTPDVEVAPQNIAELEKDYSPIKGDRDIKYIQIGLDVQGVQQRLQKLGYSISNADGVFRTETKIAVKKFETDNSLTVDGVLEVSEQQVLEKLFEDKLAKQDVQLDKAMEEMQKMLQ